MYKIETWDRLIKLAIHMYVLKLIFKKMMMRDGHIGRFALLPFSIGCDSESSVALAATATATAGTTNSPKNKQSKPSGQRSEEKKQSRAKTKQTPGLSDASVAQRLHRLINRLFKSFSQLFLYKEEDMEPIEKELEIGFPTDVKHVTHIGLDGSSRINNTPKATNEIINVAFPSISLEQFELAMTTQSNDHFPLGPKTQSSTLASL